MPTIAAFSYRHSRGLPYVYPENDRSFVSNFLSMMFRKAEPRYIADPALERALEVLFILHADHEQNCSTNTIRSAGSSLVDPYCGLAAAAAAFYGPLHGGANEAVLKMLHDIGDVERVPEFIKGVKAGEYRLMGFGHRVYKNYDPRARIIKQVADDVFAITGRNPMLDTVLELERIALGDEYFVSRKLYPNVDCYSGMIYQALGLPVAMFPVMFAIPRTAGWLAQWSELLGDSEQKIARPRQLYVGADAREFVPPVERADRSSSQLVASWCGVMTSALTMVVGYDGSESARRALDRAASLTGYGSQLIVANVASDERGLATSSLLLDEAETRLLLQRVFCRTHALVGRPARALMALADESKADLIVVGNGKTALQRLLPGSVSTEIVHNAPCDVMVVR